MGFTASLALTAANEHKIVHALRAAGAFSGATARRLPDLRLNRTRTLQDMVKSAIVRRAGAERYFLDEDVLARRRQLKGRTIGRLALAAGLVLAMTLFYLVGR